MSREEALQEEIAFWQALIERQGNEVPPDILERMHQACALATQRLAQSEVDSQSRH
jgi:hypothetical protein